MVQMVNFTFYFLYSTRPMQFKNAYLHKDACTCTVGFTQYHHQSSEIKTCHVSRLVHDLIIQILSLGIARARNLCSFPEFPIILF